MTGTTFPGAGNRAMKRQDPGLMENIFLLRK